MSYEGYERVLCAKGHLHTFDCYAIPRYDKRSHSPWDDTPEEEDAWLWICPICSSNVVWWESVDQTNSKGDRTNLKVKEEAEKCSCCGHQDHSLTRYYVPTNTGHRTNEHVPLETDEAKCEFVTHFYK